MKNSAKNAVIPFRVTEQERDAICHAADIAGVSVSEWLRDVTTRAAQRPLLVTVNGVRVSA